jgi:hypothetical protein
MMRLNDLQKRLLIILTIVTLASVLLTVSGYELIPLLLGPDTASNPTGTPSASAVTPTVPATPSPTPIPYAPVIPKAVLGIDSGPPSLYPGIGWTRLSYRTCGTNLSGGRLDKLVQRYRSQGVRVLLLLCQRPGLQLLDINRINDAAHSGADAIACGNEEMKHNTYSTYVDPANFARFFDLCESTVHAINPAIPVLLGSLDPHVYPNDIALLQSQVQYLNAMQTAMNTSVHPGGHWNWRSQIVGLIDSWHNGFPSQSINNLNSLFTFWAQQFGVNLANGGLGQHLWVVEGTGCVTGCGLNGNYQVSVAHILTLIIDVETAMRYQIPFFYFSGQDFFQQNVFWPMGVLSIKGHAKGLRQDLAPGARNLTLTCSTGQVQVTVQEQLLAKLYSGCTLPSNYMNVLVN